MRIDWWTLGLQTVNVLILGDDGRAAALLAADPGRRESLAARAPRPRLRPLADALTLAVPFLGAVPPTSGQVIATEPGIALDP